jgi:hypothetical protein
MQVDYSVELGPEAPCLELPWSSPDLAQRYLDLKRRPELLLDVVETYKNPELGEFLAVINSEGSPLETVKCDTWLTDELDAQDEVFGAAMKFGSYVDVIFEEPSVRTSLEFHQDFARYVSELLSRAPEFAAAAEFVVRRCYYHLPQEPEESEPGYYVTAYIYGYGDDEDEAHSHWAIGVKVVQNALLQASSRFRRETI